LFPLGRRRKRREEEGAEERDVDTLLHAEATTALPVEPGIVRQNLVQEFFTRQLYEVPKSELYVEHFDERVSEAAEKLYHAILTSLAKYSQKTMNIVNSRTLMASLMLITANIYAELRMKIYALEAAIEGIEKKLADPSTPRDQVAKLAEKLVEDLIMILAVPRVIPKLLKDLDAMITLNLPFRLKSDLVRNLMGYTAS